MGRQVSMTRLDRPWHRPGAVRYAVGRLPGLLRPPVSVDEHAADSLSVLRDLPVLVQDGPTLRVNVVPAGPGPYPVLMSAHPYGKDNLPKRHGRSWRVSFQYRILRQPALVHFSSLTGWEAPDPAWWAAQGYSVVSCDLRGAGTSEDEAIRSGRRGCLRPDRVGGSPAMEHRRRRPAGRVLPGHVPLEGSGAAPERAAGDLPLARIH